MRLNVNKVTEFRKCQNTKNKLKDFKEVITISSFGFTLDKVINALRIPSNHMMDIKSFRDEVFAQMYFTSIAIVNAPNYESIIYEIRENMEISFGQHGFMGVLMATVGSWAACEYFDIDIDLINLKALSLEAAWSESLQNLMREQWAYMESVIG